MNLDTKLLSKIPINDGKNTLELLRMPSIDLTIAKFDRMILPPFTYEGENYARFQIGEYTFSSTSQMYLMQSSNKFKDLELRYPHSLKKLAIHRLESFGGLDRVGVVVTDERYSIDILYNKSHYFHSGEDITENKEIVSAILDKSSSIRKVYNILQDSQNL